MAVVRAVPELQALDVLAPIPLVSRLVIHIKFLVLTLTQGFMFNIGIYMGWVNLVPGSLIPYHALTAAYLGATLWTITHETVHQH